MYRIKNACIGKIELMKNMNIKPNFSELARLIDIRLLNTIIRKKESLSKGIKKVISIRIWMRSNKKQSFVNVVRRLCSSIFKINTGSKNSNATTHLPTLPGNMISAFLITLKNQNYVMRPSLEISFRQIRKNR